MWQPTLSLILALRIISIISTPPAAAVNVQQTLAVRARAWSNFRCAILRPAFTTGLNGSRPRRSTPLRQKACLCLAVPDYLAVALC
jgi:hypothetical protein